jgi:hypothetical protein
VKSANPSALSSDAPSVGLADTESPHEPPVDTARAGTLTKRQLALRMNVSIRTVESWMQKKLIPYVKIKKTIRFIWPDVEESLRRNFGVGYSWNQPNSTSRR